jgi:ParB family chromosome partitioning protein
MEPTNKVSSNGSISEAKRAIEVLMVPCRKVRPFADQPRHYFNKDSLQELADSIDEVGQTTPGLMRRLNLPEDGYEFELIDGERRFRACILLNRLFKAEVSDDADDPKQQFKKSVASNFGREGHTPVESARAIQKLRQNGETIEAVGRIMGRSSTWVNQYSNLLKLDPQVLELLEPQKTPEEKLIVVNMGLLLVNVPMPYQLELARRISNQGLSMDKARFIIYATLNDKGITQTFRPKREFGKMATFVKKSLEHLDGIIETADVQLQHVLKSPGLQRRMALIEQVADMGEKCQQLKKKLEKIVANM